MRHELVYRSPSNPNSHLTAKDRVGPSFPTRLLLRAGLLTGRVLDFGCGTGTDVSFLRARGIDAIGFDPHYYPSEPTGRYDTIICHYVVNVLLPEEQSHVLMAVSELLEPHGSAYFSVRRDIKRGGFRTHARHGCEIYQCNVVLPYTSIFRNGHCEIYRYRHINQRQGPSPVSCPLCAPDPSWRLVTESARAYCVIDPTSTSPGTYLIVPKRHASDLSELSEPERKACWLMADRVEGLLCSRLQATGCTFPFDVRSTQADRSRHAYLRISTR